jgi:hypothetical protein
MPARRELRDDRCACPIAHRIPVFGVGDIRTERGRQSNSGMPPRALPTTGTPRASASSTTIGWFSYHREGTTTTAAASMSRCTSFLSTRPWKRTCPGATDSARARSVPSSGPVPAMSSVAPSIAPTARMAMSTPFSGESRPATRIPRPVDDCIGMSFVSMKCGTCAIRRGNTPAARMRPSRKWLGQMNTRTGEYARVIVCKNNSPAITALDPSEPSLQRRRIAW